jgi:bacterioferritin
LIEHILFLEGIPNLQRLNQVQIGETVVEQLNLDLRLEQDAVGVLTEAIAHTVAVGDFNTRGRLERMVHGEEEHTEWIETQLDTIKRVGVENYLSQQIRKE